jgi:hypothetical protein
MPQSDSTDLRPVPDPTLLTTAASDKLEATMRALIQAEITHQAELFNEKLRVVATEFNMLEARTAEQKKDTKDALDAALAAQKEAVANQTLSSEKSITKSETATIERIRAVETLLTTSTSAMDGKVGDLKDRVVAIEAIKLGNTEGAATVHQSGVDTRAIIATIISVVLALITVGTILAAILKP